MLVLLATLALLGAVASSAPAANVLSVTDTTVDAGEVDLVLTIALASDRDLTHLRFDLEYDPAFCARLDDPDVIDLTSVGHNLSPDQWYGGLLRTLGHQLDPSGALEDALVFIQLILQMLDASLDVGACLRVEFRIRQGLHLFIDDVRQFFDFV